MPTYEYICEKCGHQFELFQSMLDKALKVCPRSACAKKKWGRGRVRKVIGAGAGLIFKGSGFYITDYRSEKYREAAKKESGTGSKDSTAGSSESRAAAGEAKPAKASSPASPKSDGKPAPTRKKD